MRTLLRGTLQQFLLDHDVYVTDWTNARQVPILEGRFDFHSYIDHITHMLRAIGTRAHIVAVCQPGPPALAAACLMSMEYDPLRPASMTFMGSPIDARLNPTVTNNLACDKPFTWFQSNMIHTVPMPYPGFGRRVYPGFVQLYSFMSMNAERHKDAHGDYFNHLVENDGDGIEKHLDFYDEYLSVLDLTEEFYLQTIDIVFQKFALPMGELVHNDIRLDLRAIHDVALMTVEGEKDDISGVGQTQAAHIMCPTFPIRKRNCLSKKARAIMASLMANASETASIPASVPSLSALKKIWVKPSLDTASVQLRSSLSPAQSALISELLGDGFVIRPSPKRLSLRFDSTKRQFILNCPPRLKIHKIIEFLEQNRVWISMTAQKVPEVISLGPEVLFSLLGRQTLIEVRSGRPSLTHIYSDNEFDLGHDRLIYQGHEDQMAGRIERHIRKLTLGHAQGRALQYAQALDEKLCALRLFSARGRWGSCSPAKKTIRIHWRLGLAPVSVLDYVCAHEAAHLKHPDHSRAFWDCVGLLMPDYNEPRAWLKTNGASLHAYAWRPNP